MQIKIKDKEIIPLIQGGMGVGISLGALAGEVAKNNGVGTISAVNIGFKENGFRENSLKYNLIALEKEVKKARDISENKGLIAVNIMVAINNYEDLVRKSSELNVDLIISGAGLPLNLPEYVSDNILLAPIVSSKRALKLIIKSWMKNYNKLPDFVIVEGPRAGGHLGFKEEDLEKVSLEEIVKDISIYLKEIEEEYNKKIYLFAAGGIRNKSDRKKVELSGADGVQVATPFIPTFQCDASDEFKNAVINSKDSNIKIINSPVGMIARAIDNDFVKETEYKRIAPTKCINCLKTCNPSTTPYCITDALNNSAIGESGLVFCGDKIDKLNKIENVIDVIERIMEE